MLANKPIREFMTAAVVFIDLETPLVEAHKLLKQHDIRHLPVCDSGTPVGLLSKRELDVLLVSPALKLASVPDIMQERPYVVDPSTHVGEVVNVMLQQKYGSAMVVEDGVVSGIFTTIDALRVLHALLTSPE